MTKYYIIEHKYVGPNDDEMYFDVDDIKICSKPAKANLSGEVRTEGWCGTTDDWSVHAHGEYDSLDDAREAIVEKFGVVRRVSFTDYYEGAGMIEAYKEGELAPCTRNITYELIYDTMEDDVDAHTTNNEIDALVSEYTEYLNEDGYEPHESLKDILTEYRDDRRESYAEA